MIKRNPGLFLVLLITLFIYFPTLFYHFVGDDYAALTRIVTAPNLGEAFTFCWPAPPHSCYFRPLQWLPFFLGYTLTGLPIPPDLTWQKGHFLFAYHLLSIIFHLGSVLLVYLISAFIFKSPIYRLFTAFIFAVHPVNSEVICWVSAIGDYAFTFFSLLTLVLFAKFYLSERKIPSSLYYLGSCLSFILALCAKEVAISLPLLIIPVALFLQKTVVMNIKKRKRILFYCLVYFLLVPLYFVLRKILLSTSELQLPDLLGDILGKFLKLIYYLRDLIFPLDLSALKQFLYRNSLLPLSIVVAFFLLCLFIYFLISRLRHFPVLIFSLLWMAVMLVIPVLAPFAPMRRHLYFPLVGFSIFLVGFVSLFKRRYIGFFLLSLFIILEIWTTLGRNDLYRITGQVVQRCLFELKKELPTVEPDSVIYLVGIPGTAKNTPAFSGMSEDKIRFIYKNRDLAVFCLSMITFTEKSIKESEVVFLDDFTLMQSLQTNLEEHIRVTGEWHKKQVEGFNQDARFKILKRSNLGDVEKVLFYLNPQVLKGKKVYFIGFKDKKMQVLRSMWVR